MFCHKCGTEIAEGAVFCHKCGTQVVYENYELHNPVAEPEMAAAKASNGKLHKIIVPVLVVIALIALVISGVLQNAFDKLEEINMEIENQATGATTVPAMQSPSDIFSSDRTAESSVVSSDESSFAWVEEPYMVTEDDIFQTRYIAGAIQNVSDITFTSASVQFVLYDSAGNQIDTTSDVISNFVAGNTWRFKAIVLSDDVAYFEFLHATKTYP